MHLQEGQAGLGTFKQSVSLLNSMDHWPENSVLSDCFKASAELTVMKILF
jgi:hypothetical protein